MKYVLKFSIVLLIAILMSVITISRLSHSKTSFLDTKNKNCSIQSNDDPFDFQFVSLNQSVRISNQTLKTNAALSMRKILIITTWRSGSTFLGEIIHSAPGVFYSYEPMYYFETYNGSKTELLRSLFECQFPAEYLRFINGLVAGSQNFMVMNTRVWSACQHNRTLCNQPQFVAQLCSFLPIHLMKIVRLRIKELSPLLVAGPFSKDWKIIYLVRDPRGVMSSRTNLTWCMPDPACNNAGRLCNDVQEDLEEVDRLRNRFNNQLYLLKFEDLAADVEAETKKLFQFLRMPFTKSVHAFLNQHTQSNQTKGKPYSITRHSSTVAAEWRNTMSGSEIANITDICTLTLRTLGML